MAEGPNDFDVPRFIIKDGFEIENSLATIENDFSQEHSSYSLLEILSSDTLFKDTAQAIAILKPSLSEDPEQTRALKILLLKRNKFIYKNKDSYILNITDLTSLKQVDQLRVQNNFLNMLAANVSHEIDSPLNCITTFADKIKKESQSEAHKALALMMKNSA